MELGIFTVVFNDRPLDDVAAYAASLGYTAVELAAWRGSNHLDIDRVIADSDYVKHLRETLNRAGLRISAISNHLETQLVLGPLDASTDEFAPGRSAEEKTAFGIERAKQTARAAAVLEVPVVVGFTGSNVWNSWYSWPPGNEEMYERGWALFAERWNPILDTFKQEGVVFAHETAPPEITYNLETSERALDLVDHRPEFGFNVDPSHFVWQGIDPVVFIKRLGARVFHVHAKDAEIQVDEVRRSGVAPNGAWQRMDRGFRFRVPGWGNVEWRRVITALLEVGYNNVLSFEHEDPAMSREDGCEQCARSLVPLLIKEPLREWGIWWEKGTDKIGEV